MDPPVALKPAAANCDESSMESCPQTPPVSLRWHEQHVYRSPHFEFLAGGAELAGFCIHLEHHDVVAVLIARNQVISARIQIETSRRLALCGNVLTGRQRSLVVIHCEDRNTIRAAV